MTWRAWGGFQHAVLLAGCITGCVTAGSPVRAQTSASRYQLSAAGAESFLWIVIGEWTPHEKGYKNWVVYVDKNSSSIHSIPGPLEQTVRGARVAAAGRDLHVFYEDGTHYRYDASGGRREVRLPDAVIPEAIAGDASRSDSAIWALARTRTAEAVAVEWERTRRLSATQPSVDTRPAAGAASRPVLGAREEGGYHLVRYSGADWVPEFAVPGIPPSSERVWLAVDGKRYHFFWQASRKNQEIHYAWEENGEWTIGPTLSLDQPPLDAFVGVGNRQLAVIAMLPERGGGRCQPRVYLRPPRQVGTGTSTWSETPQFLSRDAKPLSLPAGSTAALFGDQIGIARSGAESPELAFWGTTGGIPDQDFRGITLRRSAASPDQYGSRDLRIAIALAALLLLVFWRRHTSGIL